MLVTGSFKSLMDGGEIRIYAGTVPATADASIGGATLLCTIDAGIDGGIDFASSVTSAGVIDGDSGQTLSGTNVETGTATFFRHVMSSDDGTASATALRLQGDVGLIGADMNLSSVDLVSGATLTLDRVRYALPTF